MLVFTIQLILSKQKSLKMITIQGDQLLLTNSHNAYKCKT